VEVQAGSWHISVVTEDLDYPPSHTQLEVVNGHPAISLYWDASPEPYGFWYVRAEDAMGASWGSPVLVDEIWNEFYSGDNSLMVVNGNPALAYQAGGDLELRYARANDVDGSSWGEPIAVGRISDSEGNVLSMAIVNGHPAIAYWGDYEHCGGQLVYVRANDANGDTWGSPIGVIFPDYGDSPALLVVSNAPAIAYVTCEAPIELRYVRARDADGETWGNPVTVSPESGEWLQMLIVNGNPAVSYIDYGEPGVLKYVRALDANGNTWGESLAVAGDDYLISQSPLVVQGHPVIAYDWCHGDYEHLKYVKATDPDGTNWRPPVVLDETYLGGLSLNLVNGCPAISYFDGFTNALKFAIYY
jgi:hypothetical protein